MASELELRWLKANDFKGAAKRFALFCKEDIKLQADSEQFSLDVYHDAIKLVLSKLDRSLSLVELTNRITAEEESQEIDIDDSVNIEGEEITSSDAEDIITEGRQDAD